jgi:F0F1-type ATP synthase alpha subunit
LADVPTVKIHEFHKSFYEYLKTAAPTVASEIASSKVLSDDVKAKLNSSVAEFKKRFGKAG